MKFLGLFIFMCGVAVGSVFGFLPTTALIIAAMLVQKAYNYYKKGRAVKPMGGDSNSEPSVAMAA